MCIPISGRSNNDHFLHAKACYNVKREGANCLLCPTEPLIKHYSKHWRETHEIILKNMACIFCGFATDNAKTLQSHQLFCFPKLDENSVHECGLCKARFYFKTDAQNPFYISHMNTNHKDYCLKNWKKCTDCSMFTPNFKIHKITNCAMQDGKEQPNILSKGSKGTKGTKRSYTRYECTLKTRLC